MHLLDKKCAGTCQCLIPRGICKKSPPEIKKAKFILYLSYTRYQPLSKAARIKSSAGFTKAGRIMNFPAKLRKRLIMKPNIEGKSMQEDICRKRIIIEHARYCRKKRKPALNEPSASASASILAQFQELRELIDAKDHPETSSDKSH